MNSVQLYKCVQSAVKQMYGDYGEGVISRGLKVLFLSPHTGVSFIRVRHDCYRILASSLPIVKHVDSTPCSLKCIHVGGSVRSCEKALKRYNQGQLLDVLKRCKTHDEKRQVKEALLACSLREVDDDGRWEEEEDFFNT